MKGFISAAIVALGLQSFAGVTVVQNVAPGATSWPGSPNIVTAIYPSFPPTPENFANAGTRLSETFTVTATNYVLQTIDIYAGGGSGTGAGTNLTLNLYDLGFQTAPDPSSYGGSVPTEVIGGNLFGSGAGLSVTYSSQANGVLEFDFSGSDQVVLKVGHMYAFELSGAFRTAPLNWYCETSFDYYQKGAGYISRSWFNQKNDIPDFSMAVYGTPTNNPPPPTPLTGTSTVDWFTTYQKIDGFGASSAWDGTWSTAQADMFFRPTRASAFPCCARALRRGATRTSTPSCRWRGTVARGCGARRGVRQHNSRATAA